MGKAEDLTGKRFGRLLVECRVESDKYGNSQWQCLCDCGNRKIAVASALRRGDTSSCGCRYKETRPKRINRIGEVHGRLTVLRKSDDTDSPGWVCHCSCGRDIIISYESLNSGVQSCGCLRADTVSERMTTHGLSKTRIYHIWLGMRKRCYNPRTKAYADYGARGICVCSDWVDNFQAFYDWSMANGYTDALTIERIDNSGNYCPSNCRWATAKEQNRNTRQNRLLTYNGETRCLNEWAEVLGVSRDLLRGRLSRGWSIEKTLTTPVLRARKASNTKVERSCFEP